MRTMMQNDIMGDLLTPAETANEIGRSTSTLAKDRCNGASAKRNKGPRHVLIGGKVYYRRSDLKSWVDAEIKRSIGDEAAA